MRRGRNRHPSCSDFSRKLGTSPPSFPPPLGQPLSISSEETESQRCRANHEAAELAHVRSMARRILEQRSEVEHFLLEALQQVKKEVVANR